MIDTSRWKATLIGERAALLILASTLFIVAPMVKHPPWTWGLSPSPNFGEMAGLIYLSVLVAIFSTSLKLHARNLVPEIPLHYTNMISLSLAPVAATYLLMAIGSVRETPTVVAACEALALFFGAATCAILGVEFIDRARSFLRAVERMKVLSRFLPGALAVSSLGGAALAFGCVKCLDYPPADPRAWVTIPGVALISGALLVKFASESAHGRGLAATPWLSASAAMGVLAGLEIHIGIASGASVMIWAAALTGQASIAVVVAAIQLSLIWKRIAESEVSAGLEHAEIVLVEAEPAIYSACLLERVKKLSEGPTLVISHRASPLAFEFLKRGNSLISYVISKSISHPRSIGDQEYEVSPSLSQIHAILRRAHERLGPEINVVVDSANHLMIHAGTWEGYLLLRTIVEEVQSLGGNVIIVSFPETLESKVIGSLRILASRIVLV